MRKGEPWKVSFGVSRRKHGGNAAKTHVWAELEVRLTPRDVLAMGVVQVAVHNLFREGQRALQPENGNNRRVQQCGKRDREMCGMREQGIRRGAQTALRRAVCPRKSQTAIRTHLLRTMSMFSAVLLYDLLM